MSAFLKYLLAFFENDARIAIDAMISNLKANKVTYLANLVASGESAASFLENLIVAHLQNDPRVLTFANLVQPLINNFIAEKLPTVNGDMSILYDEIVAWLGEEEKYIH